MRSWRLPVLAGLGAMLLAAGCSDGPKIVEVSGTATHQGKPVPNLLVNFEPENGRSSWGVTDQNGRFTLEYDATRKGAVVGTHHVTAMYRATGIEDEVGKSKETAAHKAIQVKYGDPQVSQLKIPITKATSSLELKLD